MKKILYTILLALSSLALMIGASCDGGWFSDPDEGNCGLVASNGINRRPILQSPEDQAIFVGPQQVTLKWWAQYGPKEDEHYRLFIDTIPINIWEQSNYEYTVDTIFVTDTLEEGIYYWAVSLYTEKYSCGHIQGGGNRSFNILPLADLIKLMEPEDGAFDVDLEENLEWELISKTGKTDYLFDVYFDIDDPPSTLIGSDISDSFFKPTLAGRTTYYWKVVGKLDNAEDIESETWSFTTLNNPPDAFSLSSPDNEATNVALDTKLEWLAATDPEGDLVTYDVLLDINNPPEAQVANDITELSYVTTTESGATYYWKVVAKDDMGAATESEIWSFTTINNAPEAALLTSPLDGATDVALDVMLEWQVSTDPDGNQISYDVLLDTNNPPVSVAVSGMNELFLMPILSSNTTYYWQVVTKDEYGAATESEIWSFTTANDIVNEVILLLPDNGASNVPLTTILTWQLSFDPGGAVYEYDIYLDTNDPPSVMISTQVTQLSYPPPLSTGTTYYWKVVGKDYSNGATVESSVWTFTTEGGSSTSSFVDSRDGQVYETVTIGSQVWMAENLAYLSELSGSIKVYGYEGTDKNEAMATDNYEKYGVLYSWQMAMDGASSSGSNPSGVQGVCPAGWHLPSGAEWSDLESYMIGEGFNNTGTALKSVEGWDYNGNGTDEFGFNGLPSGQYYVGQFTQLGLYGYWWTTTKYRDEGDIPIVWYRNLSYQSDYLRSGSVNTERALWSVRCIKDD